MQRLVVDAAAMGQQLRAEEIEAIEKANERENEKRAAERKNAEAERKNAEQKHEELKEENEQIKKKL